MRQISAYWKGRPKAWSRRVARDLRTLAPGIALILCVSSAASVIAATESIPLRAVESARGPFDRSSTSLETSEPAVESERFDRRGSDCGRSVLVDDLDQFDFEHEG